MNALESCGSPVSDAKLDVTCGLKGNVIQDDRNGVTGKLID